MPSAASLLCPRTIPCLQFAAIAPGRPYHAALSVTEGTQARGYRITEHTHDFYEMVFVLAGDAVHGLNGTMTTLRAGEIVLLRPGDWHFIRFQTGRFFHYINIAVEAELWRTFHEMTGVRPALDRPAQSDPVTALLSNATSEECAPAFRRALERFQDAHASAVALRLEICRLLATIAPPLLGAGRGDDAAGPTLFPADTPPWLIRACRLMQRDPIALREGLPRFAAEAGVTPTHLARVLRTALHQTPTQFINILRLERAARLLATTTLSILEIAGECGFEQPSYFYRLFQAQLHTSPHAYRMAAVRRVTP